MYLSLSLSLSLAHTQVSESVKRYMDEINTLTAETSELQESLDRVRVKEKSMLTDMKRKGDLARQMLLEKDEIIQQLMSSDRNNENNCINNVHNNLLIGGSISASSSSSSGTGNVNHVNVPRMLQSSGSAQKQSNTIIQVPSPPNFSAISENIMTAIGTPTKTPHVASVSAKRCASVLTVVLPVPMIVHYFKPTYHAVLTDISMP